MKKMYEAEQEKTKALEKKNQELENQLAEAKKLKGSQCSASGNKYERQIHSIVTRATINGKLFNTQKAEELAGSSSKNDLECDYNGDQNIGIEAKKSGTPDWMQCSIKYDEATQQWKPSIKGKTPASCREMFTEIINGLTIFNGKVPPFMKHPLTHAEWLDEKSKTTDWDDIYLDIPSDTIAKLYTTKGCKYIQISDGYGLFHLGNDVCNFGVPLFNTAQQLRIRTKIHTRKNKKGFCSLSVMIACQPANLKNIMPSPYSLDDKDKLPANLVYSNTNASQ